MVKRIKINQKGVREVLKSQGVVADIAQRTARAARAAGDGFERQMQMNKANTARGVVRTADRKGREREADEKVLIRVLDAMR